MCAAGGGGGAWPRAVRSADIVVTCLGVLADTRPLVGSARIRMEPPRAVASYTPAIRKVGGPRRPCEAAGATESQRRLCVRPDGEREWAMSWDATRNRRNDREARRREEREAMACGVDGSIPALPRR